MSLIVLRRWHALYNCGRQLSLIFIMTLFVRWLWRRELMPVLTLSKLDWWHQWPRGAGMHAIVRQNWGSGLTQGLFLGVQASATLCVTHQPLPAFCSPLHLSCVLAANPIGYGKVGRRCCQLALNVCARCFFLQVTEGPGAGIHAFCRVPSTQKHTQCTQKLERPGTQHVLSLCTWTARCRGSSCLLSALTFCSFIPTHSMAE